jgi:1-phosphofructokinase
MITAVSLNPAMDKLVKVSAFTYGGMNRVIEKKTQASGKGVNVAVAARQLGAKVTCAGFNFESGARDVDERLRDEGIEGRFILCPGALRVNTKILDLSAGRVTEINEPGEKVERDSVDRLFSLVGELSEKSTVMAFCGSVPAGCGTDLYARLIKSVRGCRTILDAEGELFLRGIEAAPDLVKPNLYELEIAAKRKLATRGEIINACSLFFDRGIKAAAVSMGGDGAMLVTPDSAWYAPALRVPIRSTVGAGDAMVAGLAAAMEKQLTYPDMLRWGVAAATACVCSDQLEIRAEFFDEFFNTAEIIALGG